MKTHYKIIAVMLGLISFLPTVLALSDISNSQYAEAINALKDQGVISGYSDGTYRPQNKINRAEFLKIVVGAKTSDVGLGTDCFKDVHNEWFARYVCYAQKNGIISGYPDGSFRPAQTINNVEALKILYLTNSDKGQTGGSAWYSPFVDDAKINNIYLNGLYLDSLMDRGQIAQLVYNYKKNKAGTASNSNTNTGLTNPTSSSNSTSISTPSTNSTSSPSTTTATQVGSAGGFGPKACSGVDPADGIYVSPSGVDDNADGTINKPYKSINSALAAANSGQTVILREGTYHEDKQVRVRKPNITIKSKNGEWAVIDFAGQYEDAAVYFDVDSSGSKLQCVEVIGGFYAFATETKWDWGDPNDRKGASDIVIEDSKLHGSGRDVIKIKPNSDNIIIRRNEIYDSGKNDNVDGCNAEGIDNVNGDNMKVQNNYIHNICSNGVYCKGGAMKCLIENNKLMNIGEAGILLGFDTSPEYFDLTVNPDYYENIDGIARNNLIINTGASGIGMYAAKSPQIYNNTLVNVASTKDYHSAIYFGITFQDWVDEAKRPATVNPAIHDNIISEPNSVQRPMIEIRHTDELGGLEALEGKGNFYNNCYYIAGKEAQFKDGRPNMLLELSNFAAWISHIGSENGSVEINPMLGENYTVPGGSICTGRGYKQ